MWDYAAVLIRVVLATVLTGGLLTAAAFAAMMIACSGGGALIVWAPLAIVALPLSLTAIKLLKSNMKGGTFFFAMLTGAGFAYCLMMFVDEGDIEYIFFAVLAGGCFAAMVALLVREHRTRTVSESKFKGFIMRRLGRKDSQSSIKQSLMEMRDDSNTKVGNYETLVTYVENARAYGATDDTIRDNLTSQGGWSEGEVTGAFSLADWRRDQQSKE